MTVHSFRSPNMITRESACKCTCMRRPVCVNVCMHACVSVCMHACVHACVCACVCVRMYAQAFVIDNQSC